MSDSKELASAAVTAEALGDWDEAIGIWRQLADAEPDIRWWLRLADAYEGAGQADTADDVRADAVTATLGAGEAVAAMVAACAARADVAGLFSGRRDLTFLGALTAAQFAELAPALSRRSLADGEYLMRQGDRARALYILARGTLEVTAKDSVAREVIVARLTPGAVVGEMALVLNRPRSASVRAAEPAELLAVELDALKAIAAENPGIAKALDDYADARLIKSVVATSPLLRGVAPSARDAALSGFQRVAGESGQRFAEEGLPSPGIFVVAQGQVAVRRDFEGKPATLTKLGPGDVFGEIAALSDGVATATVEATEPCTLLSLSAIDFAALCDTHPAVRAQMQALSDRRVGENRSIFDVPTLELEISDEVIDFEGSFFDED